MYCDVFNSNTIDFFIHRLSDEVLLQAFTMMFWVKFAGVNLGHSQVRVVWKFTGTSHAHYLVCDNRL